MKAEEAGTYQLITEGGHTAQVYISEETYRRRSGDAVGSSLGTRPMA